MLWREERERQRAMVATKEEEREGKEKGKEEEKKREEKWRKKNMNSTETTKKKNWFMVPLPGLGQQYVSNKMHGLRKQCEKYEKYENVVLLRTIFVKFAPVSPRATHSDKQTSALWVNHPSFFELLPSPHPLPFVGHVNMEKEEPWQPLRQRLMQWN